MKTKAEGRERMFAGAVNTETRDFAPARDRADVRYDTAASGAHVWEDGLRDGDVAEDVYNEVFLEFDYCVGFYGSRGDDPGVVHEVVDWAVVGDSAGYRGLDNCREGGQVERYGDGPKSSEVRECLGVTGGTNHFIAGCEGSESESGTEAARAAGNEPSLGSGGNGGSGRS